MTHAQIVSHVWLPAYLTALGRGHDTTGARRIAGEAVTDFRNELARCPSELRTAPFDPDLANTLRNEGRN